ncbi:helix-turn-helix domain-containing protein [Acidobacteriota bacterium]
MTEIGESLKNEREKRGIPLEQVSHKTNISVKFLEALEAGDYHLIPGKFYLKGYIKNYLQVLDVDVNEFLAAHQNLLESSGFVSEGGAKKIIPKLRYSRFKKRSLFFNLFTILIILLIFTSGFFYLYKKKMFPDWSFIFKKANLPATGIMIDPGVGEFDVDRSPVNIRISFTDQCWTLLRRGKGERIEKTYEKGDKLTFNGYELSLYIGNPAAVKFFLNEKEITYLNTLTQPERLEINPGTL